MGRFVPRLAVDPADQAGIDHARRTTKPDARVLRRHLERPLPQRTRAGRVPSRRNEVRPSPHRKLELTEPLALRMLRVTTLLRFSPSRSITTSDSCTSRPSPPPSSSASSLRTRRRRRKPSSSSTNCSRRRMLRRLRSTRLPRLRHRLEAWLRYSAWTPSLDSTTTPTSVRRSVPAPLYDTPTDRPPGNLCAARSIAGGRLRGRGSQVRSKFHQARRLDRMSRQRRWIGHGHDGRAQPRGREPGQLLGCGRWSYGGSGQEGV